MSNYSKTHKDPHQLEWERKYQQLFQRFLALHRNDIFDGSAVAAWMRKQGLYDPSHHNQWGTQIKHYAHLGWIQPVGRGVPSGAAHTAQVRLWKAM